MKKDGFFEKVYEIVDTIPIGKVATYGQIARLLGRPRSAKIVGWALHVNPNPISTPCHRVVNRNGELAGSFAFGGSSVQHDLLVAEGVTFIDEKTVNMQLHHWEK